MDNNEKNSVPSSDAPRKRSRKRGSIDYLSAAQKACDAGNDVLGLHLYLAAYETASQEGTANDDAAIDTLRKAWDLAIELKERSMAEYVFERLEPHLSSLEMSEYTNTLQELALDRLVKFGFSREDLEGVAGTVVSLADDVKGAYFETGADEVSDLDLASLMNGALDGFMAFDGMPFAGSVSEGSADASDVDGRTEEKTDLSSLSDVSEEAGAIAPSREATSNEGGLSPQTPTGKKRETYAELAGFEKTVALMRGFGIGVGDDEGFSELVDELNARHGLDRMPAPDALLFSASVREDANRFVGATERELGLPVVRMALEESFQGALMLVITAEGIDFRSRQSFMRLGFSQPMTLVMEDVDLWQIPEPDFDDAHEGSRMQASAARTAREGLAAMRSAIQNPNVHVLATATDVSSIDPFVMELLSPVTIVEIELPNELERESMWRKLAKDHPSMAEVSVSDLVRLSAGLPRFDIEMAAREAVEEAYKYGLATRGYVPVTAQNIFEKLAAYQPLDSDEFRELEQKVLDDFRADLDNLDDLLDGGVK